MRRACNVISWLFGSLGVALLAISVVLVPTSRALAAHGTICANTNTCITNKCQESAQYGCFDYADWCKQIADQQQCKHCHCKVESMPPACDCTHK